VTPSSLVQILAADEQLLSAVDRAQAEATRRSGAWLACRPGCTPCCHGPFAITALDALRLREALAQAPAPIAEAVRHRAAASVARLTPVYPGDPQTGALLDEDDLPDSLNQEPCPALDPATGRCDLYAARPLTCRTFGPAALTADGSYGACELCYEGASPGEIAACAVEPDPAGREAALLDALAQQGHAGLTVVAFALRP